MLIYTLLIQLISAHAFVKRWYIDGKAYTGWSPWDDPQYKQMIERSTQKFWHGPVIDFTSPDITCGIGGNVPTTRHAVAKAGSIVTMQLNQWATSHIGPIMVYMAYCGSSCSTFKGDTGAPWFKVSERGFTGTWATMDFMADEYRWDVEIPKDLLPGAYLIRFELLALHMAMHSGGAQFYPHCAQLQVTGDGCNVPEGISFPGEYKRDGEGILYDAFKPGINYADYLPPGGDPYIPNSLGSCE